MIFLSEAQAFDNQIVERIKNGHIPDLRYTQPCDYFYNNSWRRPEYVKMDYGEIFELIRDAVQQYCKFPKPKVLEVGCGPGFISLELSRAGFDVTGIDLSDECINVAKKFAGEDPHILERGKLEYLTGDFFSHKDLSEKYNAIVFVGALHHFPDQQQIMNRCKDLLAKDGILIAHEPTRDRVEKRNAAVFLLIKAMLHNAGGYFEKVESFNSASQIDSGVERIYKKMKYESEDGEKLQSVNDNSAGYNEMIKALNENFEQVAFQNRYAFFHEIIGGLRFSENQNVELAKTIKLFDKYFCEQGILQPAEFFYVGRKNNL